MSDHDYQQALAAAEQLLGRPLELPLGPGEPASGADFRRLATIHTFGDSWTRAALGSHDRALVSVAIAATLGTREPLRGQLRIALRAGVSRDQIVDLFIHLEAYAGAARAFESYQTVLEVFAEDGAAPPPTPQASMYAATPIGWVESPLTDRAQAPRQGTEGAPDAWLVFDPAVADGLTDLTPGTEIIVLTWLDRADRTVLVTRPRDDPARPPTGVFSTRSPDRPNPVGLHRVHVVAMDGLRILVRPLEALDGTPVIDVKPVLDKAAER
jgi:tRNA-Thr(GGU) m(6)t(6)A37 methyltransferase TsaA